MDWRFNLEFLINRLQELISIRSNANICFSKFLLEAIEIEELKLIGSYYMLNHQREFHNEILRLNNKYHTNLDPYYFEKRWNKFYAATQNNKFDDMIKRQIIHRDQSQCCYCYFTEKLEVHHVLPQEKNGSHSVYNLVTACEKCNRSIGANIVIPQNWWSLHPEPYDKYAHFMSKLK
ncbi:MAG: HNH endonuclease [bacterium]